MNLTEFIKKSKTSHTEEELREFMKTKNVLRLADGGFLCYEQCLDNTIVIHHLYAPGKWKEVAEDVQNMFKGRKLLFLTRRDSRAWRKLGWGRMVCLGNLMEIDLTG